MGFSGGEVFLLLLFFVVWSGFFLGFLCIFVAIMTEGPSRSCSSNMR